jgi:hypothetical protein
MRQTRTIVAVTLLATAALCADRAAASTAVQASRVQAQPVARGFAQRLTVSLRSVVPAVKLHQSRQDGLVSVVCYGGFEGPQAVTHLVEGSPFQFRLPPPLV